MSWTWENTGDWMVDTVYFRSLEAVSSEPPCNAESRESTGTSSLHRDLFLERSKSRLSYQIVGLTLVVCQIELLTERIILVQP